VHVYNPIDQPDNFHNLKQPDIIIEIRVPEVVGTFDKVAKKQ
jgi:hypothetical protein